MASASGWVDGKSPAVQFLRMVGSTPVALLISVLAAMYFLGTKRGMNGSALEKTLDGTLGPVCSVILITGAGGMFGGVLRASGIGDALKDSMAHLGVPVLLGCFLVALALRIAQGSATVALTTAAGLMANAVAAAGYNDWQLAGVVLANGSMSSNQSGEGDIRQAMLEAANGAGIVDCMVALPGQLFYSTQIPACLWILAKDRSNGFVLKNKLRDRRGQVLFIDARKMGVLVDRTRRELTDEEIRKIAETYHAWRGEAEAGDYADVPGFCKSATLEEIRKHGHVLTPGRYVGAAAQEDDGEPFAEKMQRLSAQWREQCAAAARIDAAIEANLKELGYGE